MSLDFITVSVPVSKTQKQKQFSSFLQAEIRKKRKKKSTRRISISPYCGEAILLGCFCSFYRVVVTPSE